MRPLDRDIIKGNFLDEIDDHGKRLDILERLIGGIKYSTYNYISSGGGGADEGPGIDIVNSFVGFGGDTVLVYNSDGLPVEEYAASYAGLYQALASATTGESVEWPNIPITITAGISVPAGVTLRGRNRFLSIINAALSGANIPITLGASAALFNLTLSNIVNDANIIYGVVGPVTGTGYIFGCDITAAQSGAGNAYAVGAINALTFDNGNLDIQFSKLYGSSAGGSGYAGRSIAGVIYSRHNRYYGSTDRWALA